MNTTLAALIVFGCRCGCVARKDSCRLLPENHLTAGSRDMIKLAMGLVASMMPWSLLVSSAKGVYDTKRPCSTRCTSSQMTY